MWDMWLLGSSCLVCRGCASSLLFEWSNPSIKSLHVKVENLSRVAGGIIGRDFHFCTAYMGTQYTNNEFRSFCIHVEWPFWAKIDVAKIPISVRIVHSVVQLYSKTTDMHDLIGDYRIDRVIELKLIWKTVKYYHIKTIKLKETKFQSFFRGRLDRALLRESKWSVVSSFEFLLLNLTGSRP